MHGRGQLGCTIPICPRSCKPWRSPKELLTSTCQEFFRTSPGLARSRADRYSTPKLPSHIHSRIRRSLAILCVAAFAIVLRTSAWQQELALPNNPLPEKTGPLRKALLLLRESKTAEARKDLEEQRKLRPEIGRAH